MRIGFRPTIRSRSGLTLIELIAVIVILAILAGAALPAMNRIGQTRSATAAQHLAADLTVARQYAVTSGNTVWMQFEPSEHRWSMLMEAMGEPGRANAAVMDDPATGRPFVIQLDAGPFIGVQILQCSFDGQQRIGFDWRGRPMTDDETPLEVTGDVVLTNQYRVAVEPSSGLVTYVRP